MSGLKSLAVALLVGSTLSVPLRDNIRAAHRRPCPGIGPNGGCDWDEPAVPFEPLDPVEPSWAPESPEHTTVSPSWTRPSYIPMEPTSIEYEEPEPYTTVEPSSTEYEEPELYPTTEPSSTGTEEPLPTATATIGTDYGTGSDPDSESDDEDDKDTEWIYAPTTLRETKTFTYEYGDEQIATTTVVAKWPIEDPERPEEPEEPKETETVTSYVYTDELWPGPTVTLRPTYQHPTKTFIFTTRPPLTKPASVSSSKYTSSKHTSQSTSSSTSSPSPSSSGLKKSPNGTCGKKYGYTCLGFGAGECCSTWDWCGNARHCVPQDCQAGFGKCGEEAMHSSYKSGNLTTSTLSKISASTKTATKTTTGTSTYSATKSSTSKPILPTKSWAPSPSVRSSIKVSSPKGAATTKTNAFSTSHKTLVTRVSRPASTETQATFFSTALASYQRAPLAARADKEPVETTILQKRCGPPWPHPPGAYFCDWKPEYQDWVEKYDPRWPGNNGHGPELIEIPVDEDYDRIDWDSWPEFEPVPSMEPKPVYECDKEGCRRKGSMLFATWAYGDLLDADVPTKTHTVKAGTPPVMVSYPSSKATTISGRPQDWRWNRKRAVTEVPKQPVQDRPAVTLAAAFPDPAPAFIEFDGQTWSIKNGNELVPVPATIAEAAVNVEAKPIATQSSTNTPKPTSTRTTSTKPAAPTSSTSQTKTSTTTVSATSAQRPATTSATQSTTSSFTSSFTSSPTSSAASASYTITSPFGTPVTVPPPDPAPTVTIDNPPPFITILEPSSSTISRSRARKTSSKPVTRSTSATSTSSPRPTTSPASATTSTSSRPATSTTWTTSSAASSSSAPAPVPTPSFSYPPPPPNPFVPYSPYPYYQPPSGPPPPPYSYPPQPYHQPYPPYPYPSAYPPYPQPFPFVQPPPATPSGSNRDDGSTDYHKHNDKGSYSNDEFTWQKEDVDWSADWEKEAEWESRPWGGRGQ